MSHQLPDIVKMIEDYGILKYRAGCTSGKSSVKILETASQVKANLIAAITSIASVKREPLSPALIREMANPFYSPEGFDEIAFVRITEQAHGIGVLDDKVQPIKYPSSTASQWLPIDSAPKDDLFVAKGNKFNDPAKGQFYVIAKREDDSFIDDADDCPSPFLTHWMPLPPPPVTATTARENMEDE